MSKSQAPPEVTVAKSATRESESARFEVSKIPPALSQGATVERGRALGHHIARLPFHRPSPQIVQRAVDAGLAAGTQVRWNGRTGRIIEEKDGGYIVEFVTAAQPPLTFRPNSIPYADLDPVEDEAIDEEEAEEEQAEEEQAEEEQAEEEQAEEEQAFEGDLSELPESVTVGGVAMSWVESGNNYLLKPDSGANFPHFTFMGNQNLGKFHFTTAAFDSARNQVSVKRRGYAWSGMQNKLVADPGFPEAEQFLNIKSNAGGVVTFDLSGGRQNMTVSSAAVHAAIPSVADVADALGIPS